MFMTVGTDDFTYPPNMKKAINNYLIYIAPNNHRYTLWYSNQRYSKRPVTPPRRKTNSSYHKTIAAVSYCRLYLFIWNTMNYASSCFICNIACCVFRLLLTTCMSNIVLLVPPITRYLTHT